MLSGVLMSLPLWMPNIATSKVSLTVVVIDGATGGLVGLYWPLWASIGVAVSTSQKEATAPAESRVSLKPKV